MNISFTQVPNILFDVHLPTLTEAELKILLVITRQTYGWINNRTGKRKTKDRISRSQFIQKTGLSPKAISTAIQNLINKQIIKVFDYNGMVLYKPSLRKGKTILYYSLSISQNQSQRTYKMSPIQQLF